MSVARSCPALVALLFCLGTAQAGAQSGPTPEALKRLSIEELLAIDITTVSRRAEPLSATPAAVQVITADDIRRSGATTIADAMRLADGVEVAQSASNIWNITARGFNQGTANKLLVMVDGRTVYSPLFTGVFWNTIDYLLEDIDRIEIIRGPGATLWGANAVNGVINIVTRHSRDTQGSYATVSAGNEDTTLVGGRYGGAFGTTTWRTYGLFGAHDVSAFASGAGAFDDRRRGQAGFRIDGGNPLGTTWLLKGDAFHSREGIAGRLSNEHTDLNVQAKLSRPFANESRLELQSYYRREFRRQPGQLTHHIDILDVDAQHSLTAGERHRMVWGGGFRVNWDDTHGTVGLHLNPVSRTHGLANAFVQDEVALVPDRLFATLGAKVEYNSFSGSALLPAVRTRLMLTPDRMFWTAISRADRRPSRLEDDLVAGSDQFPLFVGSDDFVPEQLIAYEGGYRTKISRLVSADVSLFRHDFSDLRSLDLGPTPGSPMVLANSLEGESWGSEAALDLQPRTDWRTHVSYTFLDTDVRARPGSHVALLGQVEANDPHHLFSVRTSIDLPRGIELDASLRYVGALPDPVVPAITSLGLRLGWRPTTRLEVFASGRDLLDRHHPEFGTPFPGRVEIERAFRIGVTIR